MIETNYTDRHMLNFEESRVLTLILAEILYSVE